MRFIDSRMSGPPGGSLNITDKSTGIKFSVVCLGCCREYGTHSADGDFCIAYGVGGMLVTPRFDMLDEPSLPEFDHFAFRHYQILSEKEL